MKFLELLERLFENPDLEFKLEGDDCWSSLVVNDGDNEFTSRNIGVRFLNNHGYSWWPTVEEMESDRWEIKGEPLKTKFYKLFVVAERKGNWLINDVIGLRKKKVTSKTVEDIRELLLKKIQAQHGSCLKKNEIVITNWLWLDD